MTKSVESDDVSGYVTSGPHVCSEITCSRFRFTFRVSSSNFLPLSSSTPFPSSPHWGYYISDDTMDSFSWSDSVQAVFGSCLACMGRSSRPDSNNEHGNERSNVISRTRSDELEGLLADSDDAETLSLHSNLGDRDRSRRKKRQRKGIRLFGYDLFGRPPIHLPDDEEDDIGRPRRRERVPDLQRTRTISTSTLDSDASPLDPSTIEELSVARVAEQVAKEEEERRAKEERRQRRRERKELKRAALALAMSGEGEFEGFQVSVAPGIHTPHRPSHVECLFYREVDPFMAAFPHHSARQQLAAPICLLLVYKRSLAHLSKVKFITIQKTMLLTAQLTLVQSPTHVLARLALQQGVVRTLVHVHQPRTPTPTRRGTITITSHNNHSPLHICFQTHHRTTCPLPCRKRRKSRNATNNLDYPFQRLLNRPL